jgi:hypothetical protein
MADPARTARVDGPAASGKAPRERTKGLLEIVPGLGRDL